MNVAPLTVPGSTALASDERLTMLDLFSEVAGALLTSQTVEQTIFHTMRFIVRFFSPESWSFLLYHPRRDSLEFVYASGPGAEAILGKEFPRERGIAGWVVTHRSGLLITDAYSDDRFDPSFDAASGFRTKTIVAAPLLARGKVFGVIELINTLEGLDSFSREDSRLLDTLANFAALALERIRSSQELRRLAFRDHLTKLENRRSFHRQLNREILMTKRFRTSFSLLFIDVDAFKAINDTFGHDAGDRVLQRVACILKKSVRAVDFVSRLGGDEFVVLLPHANRDMAETTAARIRSNTKGCPTQEEIAFSLSVGVTVVDLDCPDSILMDADKAMYRAKQSSKDEARNRA